MPGYTLSDSYAAMDLTRRLPVKLSHGILPAVPAVTRRVLAPPPARNRSGNGRHTPPLAPLMQIRKLSTLRGSNTWAWFPVLEAVVDLQELKDSPSNELPGFNERLMAWLPSMIEHRCSIGERGGFFERLRRGTYQGHILEHVTLELQQLAGCNVGFGKARDRKEGVYKVIIEFEDASLGLECFRTAMRLNHAAVYDEPFDIAAELERLRYGGRRTAGPQHLAIVDAARAARDSDLPAHDRQPGATGLGYAAAANLTAETDGTSAIAEAIAQDKELTAPPAAHHRAPVPEGTPVKDADDAWEAAQEIGPPVVVKRATAITDAESLRG